MKYSVKLTLNRQRVRADQTAALFFQVILNRTKTTVPINLYWPVEHFDAEKGTIIRQGKTDKLYEDYCREIDRLRGEINEIFIWARLSRIELTVDTFKEELKHAHSRSDFLSFWEREVEERGQKGKIKNGSYKAQKSSLENLKRFRPTLPFSQINKKLLEDYKSYLINKEGLKGNTVWNKFKDFRTYLNLAKAAGHHFDYAFKGFKMPKLQGRIEYLEEEEFQKMKSYYYSGRLEEGDATTLRAFLFSCYTGLRISDTKAVSWAHVKKDLLIFQPQKRTQDMDIEVIIPLCKAAKELLITKRGKLVETRAEQVMNRMLKKIADKLGIQKEVTFHWARHTFATRFLRHGGRLEVLQKLMGHANIKSTMIYVHVDTDRMRNEINLLT